MLETSLNHQGRYFPEMTSQTLLLDEKSRTERLRNEGVIVDEALVMVVVR